MKTNIFILRALVGIGVTGDNTGTGIVIEQTFKTERFYDITVSPNSPSWKKGKPDWLVTEGAVIETEKGTIILKTGVLDNKSDALNNKSDECFATIDVGLSEDVVNGTFTINPGSIRFELNGKEVNQDISASATIHAAAVRVHCGESDQDSTFNNTHQDVYLDSHSIVNSTWLIERIVGGQNAGRHAFDNPRFTAEARGIAHINGAVEENIVTENSCCEAENNNLLILAATNLIASNNPLNSMLVGKLKDVLDGGSNLESTREFLTYASKMGALTNVGHVAAKQLLYTNDEKGKDGKSEIRNEEVVE